MGVIINLSTQKDTRHSISNQLYRGKQKNQMQTIPFTKDTESAAENQKIQERHGN